MSHFRSIAKEEDVVAKVNKDNTKDKQELGGQAAWSLSSAKPGFGVEQLRDNNFETYWQSDGTQPHFVNIQFHKKVTVDELELYCDMKLDESYTPHKMSIRAGTTFHDLREIKTLELAEPQGWVSIPLCSPEKYKRVCLVNNASSGGQLRTNFVQLAILTNHQNGRDSHIRQIRIYGPRPYTTTVLCTNTVQAVDILYEYARITVRRICYVQHIALKGGSWCEVITAVTA